MGSLSIVVRQPGIKIRLQLLKSRVVNRPGFTGDSIS